MNPSLVYTIMSHNASTLTGVHHHQLEPKEKAVSEFSHAKRPRNIWPRLSLTMREVRDCLFLGKPQQLNLHSLDHMLRPDVAPDSIGCTTLSGLLKHPYLSTLHIPTRQQVDLEVQVSNTLPQGTPVHLICNWSHWYHRAPCPPNFMVVGPSVRPSCFHSFFLSFFHSFFLLQHVSHPLLTYNIIL
jgi:hypothetical protein